MLAACLGLCASAWAAGASDPFLALPAGDVACTVVIVDPAAQAPPAPPAEKPAVTRPAKAEITRVKKISRIAISWTDGRETEVWKPGKLRLTFFPEPGSAKVKIARGFDRLPPAFNLDANPAWWSWVGKGSYAGPSDYRGKPCDHYQKVVRIEEFDPEPERPAPARRYQMWIDPETRLPVAFDDGEFRYEFSFGVPPQTLELPARIARELARYEALLSPARRL